MVSSLCNTSGFIWKQRTIVKGSCHLEYQKESVRSLERETLLKGCSRIDIDRRAHGIQPIIVGQEVISKWCDTKRIFFVQNVSLLKTARGLKDAVVDLGVLQ